MRDYEELVRQSRKKADKWCANAKHKEADEKSRPLDAPAGAAKGG